jgi:tetratricopeptide (TPR) repeat protein
MAVVSLFDLWFVISSAAVCVLWYGPAGLASAEHDDVGGRLRAADELWDAGDKAGAEKLLLTALKETARSGNDVRRAKVLSKLGSAYHSQGRYAAAEECYRRAIGIWKDRDHGSAEHVRSIGNLAALYTEIGQYGKADRMDLRSLVARASEFRLDRADIAWLLATLGALDYRRGRYAEAERDQKAALAISEKLAPHGPETMQILNNLGLVQAKTRHYAEALASYERALAIAEAAVTLDYPMQARILANLGTTQLVASGPLEAEPFYTKALELAENRLGAAHPLVGRILSCYAVVLRQTKRKAEASDVERHARAILQAHSRDDFTHMLVDAGDMLRRRSN